MRTYITITMFTHERRGMLLSNQSPTPKSQTIIQSRYFFIAFNSNIYRLPSCRDVTEVNAVSEMTYDR